MPHSVEEQFYAAVWIIQHMPKEGPIQISTWDKLKMYALYKQATVGPCNTPQPYMIQIEERLKWNAWSEQGGKEKEEAMAEYVEFALQLIEKAEAEHDIMDYISNPKYTEDPKIAELLEKEDELREKFAILGRTNVKGHEGKVVEVNGKKVQL